MKTLKNHVILYDAECPMCHAYTKAFVKTGMLDSAGRHPYQQMPEQICPYVDKHRAVNEIALVDVTTGEVSYGIRSLFKIIGNAIPLFSPLFRFPPFIWIMTKVYAFISYNRKVIIPANTTGKHELQPDFKLTYRIAYLIFTVVIAAYILAGYAPLFASIIPAGGAYRELIVCSGQLIFQGTIISVLDKSKTWDYLGNMMTISFAGALLLLPVLALPQWIQIPDMYYAAYFMLVAGMMLLEHIRRTKLMGLGWTMTIGWTVYRLIVLIVILKIS